MTSPTSLEAVPDAPGVGLGAWQVSADASQWLIAYGLGSCVAVVLYDAAGVAGLAHVMLPDSRGNDGGTPCKYADTAVPHLVSAVCEAGGMVARLTAVLCGGASMFSQARLPEIGVANHLAVRQALASRGIPIAAEDVGGTRGRTVRVEVGTGRVMVTTVGRDPIELRATLH